MIERRAIVVLAGVILFALAAAGGAWLAVRQSGPEPRDPVSVSCWDGSAVASAAECPLPTGLEGLRSVFPSLRPDCAIRDSREGKAEIFVCGGRGLVIRYSRWDPFIDRIAYFHDENPDSFIATWNAGGTEAGVQWTSRETRDEKQPWQWSATYASHPYSISVEGATKADRRRGIKQVRAVSPGQIGLAAPAR